MIYVGNFKDWINPYALDVILTFSGEKRPLEKELEEERKIGTVGKWLESGYKLDRLSWEFFYSDHVGNLEPPIPVSSNYKWWISKLKPGEIFPMHIDSFPDDGKKITRYWMAMQDRLPGHIFCYNDIQLDYVAGDMYIFDEARDWHGAANIGFIPKISYQLVVFD
jgi:hypothetical protein